MVASEPDHDLHRKHGRPMLLLGGAALTIVAVGLAGMWLATAGQPGVPGMNSASADGDAMDPARGCAMPALSREEAESQFLGSLTGNGYLEGEPIVASVALMTGSAFAWAQDSPMDEAPDGCVWFIEVHGKYTFTRYPPSYPRGAEPTLSPPSWQRLIGAVGSDDSETIGMQTQFGGHLCAAPGTPCPTRPPPPDGWPTARPTEPMPTEWESLPGFEITPYPTPAPP